MGDVSGGNCFIKNHTLSKYDCDSNNSDVISGHGFINSHNIYECDDSSTFKYMDGCVEKGDTSSGYGSMNIHNDYQHNGLK